MKALERYVKKSGAKPYGATETKGKWKGSKGPQMDDQYAEENGKPVMDDKQDCDETDPSSAGSSAFESIKSKGPKKKQRTYLKD